MKRTDLIALTARMHMMARAVQEAADSEPEARFGLDLQDSAELIEQIAQAQPVRGAMFGMYGVGRITLVADGSEREWVDKCGGSLLYALPLED